MEELVLCEDDNLLDQSASPSSSSDSSQNDDIDIITVLLNKDKRHSIKGYVESVVPDYSDKEFIKHFRINKETFNMLIDRYENSSEYRELTKNKRLKSAKFHLLLFLWFAGHEAASFTDLGDRFDVSISTVHCIIKRVTHFLSCLSEAFIKWPNDAEKHKTEEYYFRKYKFPGVIGSIDGTHIKIDPPEHGKDEYIDRKGDITLHLQGICNEQKMFINIFCGYPGSVHDARVFRNSDIYIKLPQLCQDKYILGDSAYPCIQHLLSPYRDNGHLTAAQRNYNYKLSQCRVDIENTFGILKQRFRQLYYCKLKGIKYLCHFIRACCVLHNLSKIDEIVIFNEENLDDFNTGNIEQEPDAILSDTALGKAIRDNISRQLPNK